MSADLRDTMIKAIVLKLVARKAIKIFKWHYPLTLLYISLSSYGYLFDTNEQIGSQTLAYYMSVLNILNFHQKYKYFFFP